MCPALTLPLYYGAPPISQLEQITKTHSGIAVSRDGLLDHAVIFLRESGFPVYIIGEDEFIPENSPKKHQIAGKNGAVFNIFALCSSSSESHALPVGLFRTEAPLALSSFPTLLDYMTFLNRHPSGAIRLFDFLGDKESLLRGLFSQKVAENLQIGALSMLKKPFFALIPHAERLESLDFYRRALPRAQLGIMLEGELHSAEELISQADFVYIGTNDLLRLNPDVGELLRKVGKITHFCEKYAKKLTICGEICENGDFLSVLADFGVQNLCISERRYYQLKKTIECFT